MAATVNSLFDSQSARIEERISKTLEVFLAQADPVWRETVLSSEGVGGVDQLGRGMELRKTYLHAVAGVIESGATRADFTTYGDETGFTKYGNVSSVGAPFALQTPTRTFPDANEDPSGLPLYLRVPMRSIMTNLKTTTAERNAEALPAFIGQIVAPRMVAFARNLSRRLCSSWYTSQSSNYRLCSIGANTGTGAYTVDAANKALRFYPTNYAVSRLAVGDRVDIYRIISGQQVRLNDTAASAPPVTGDSANQNTTTRVKAFIVRVNKLQGWVDIQFDPAASAGLWAGSGALTATGLSTDAFLVWANSNNGGTNNTFTDIPGIHSWLKFGGSTADDKQLLGNEALGTVGNGIIDVSVYPQFQSFLKNVNNVLTEQRLNLYLDRVGEAFEDEGHYIDTLVTTQGVIRAAMAQKGAREILDRTGRLSTLTNEGEDGKGMVHNHQGKSYMLHTTRWMEYGTLLGYRRTNNWKRYSPPPLAGGQAMPGTEAGIPFEFVTQAITGLPSNRWPILQNGQLTEASQMPGHLRMTLVPETQVRGMKLTGLTEERVWGDTN